MKDRELANFELKGQNNRRFNFQEGSLALKALQDGAVDFHDEKLMFSASKVDLS